MPQLSEITSKAQDIINENKSDVNNNTEITEAIERLSKNIKDLKVLTESQKVR